MPHPRWSKRLPFLYFLMIISPAQPAAAVPTVDTSFDVGRWEYFYEACRADAQWLCPNEAPIVARTSHCLSDQRDQLSTRCYEALVEISSGAGRERLHKACSLDQQAWCHGLSMDDGSLARCMQEHMREFSAECQRATIVQPQLETCQADVIFLCSRLIPRDLRLRACITANATSVTAGCREAIPK